MYKFKIKGESLIHQSGPNPWFRIFRPNPHSKMRLFCFPYAGGSASIFNEWYKFLPEEIEVIGIEFPGRGSRFLEKPVNSISEIQESLFPELLPLLDKPFAFFGHSMGAMIAYETVRRFTISANTPLPTSLFVSGSRAIQYIKDGNFPLSISDSELINFMKKMKGTPLEILQNDELMELFLPILKSDLTLIQNYVKQKIKPIQIPCNIYAYGGTEDEAVPIHYLEAWKEWTLRSFELTMIPGDHFFINHDKELIVNKICSHLKTDLLQHS